MEIRAKKSLGQHFLTSKNIAKEIAEAAHVGKNDIVLEIGPGKGILTEVLLEKAGKVIAVEKDDSLVLSLQARFQNEIEEKKLVLLHGDILDEDIQKQVFENIKTQYKIVANIPYFITGKLTRLFFSFDLLPDEISLLVQKEVAERVVAKNKKESILSLSVKAYGTPHYIKTVKAGSFSPPPKVDSAILSIQNISRDFFEAFSEDAFFTLLHLGFAHKRKQLQKNLKDVSPDADYKLNHLPPKVRAEDLTLDNWKEILSSH